MNESSRSTLAWAVWASWRIVLGLLLVFLAFTLSYWATSYLYGQSHASFGSYWSIMATVGIAFLFLFFGGMVIGRITGQRQQAVWQTIIEAIRQMAKGNFDVKLDVDMISDPGGENHPFHQLVHSINDMAEELAILERMRQEFISDVSHEIQSPLTSITGFAKALQTGDVPPEAQQRYLQIIENESMRLSRLSDNLLKLTSLESGYHPVHLQHYRLDKQIRDIVLSCEPLWAGKGIELKASLPALDITADRDLLSQVWVNILTNAVKFTGHGGSIAVSASNVADGWLEVSIADTGIGLEGEAQKRIFERFYKVDKARGSEAAGGGLGLSIVKKIIDLHGGNVSVESLPGVGSTFTVSLPVQPPVASPASLTVGGGAGHQVRRI